MIKKILLFVLVLGLGILPTVSYAYSHYSDELEVILRECVSDGKVSIAKLREESFALQTFLNNCAQVSYTEFIQGTAEDEISFLINYYNGAALSLMLKNEFADDYRLYSTTADEKIFLLFGEKHSLKEIRHLFIRGRFDDERILFSLFLPACVYPLIPEHAFAASELNLSLEGSVLKFISDERRVLIDKQAGFIKLSPLFKWFGKDFLKRYSSSNNNLLSFSEEQRAVIEFLAQYRPREREFLEKGQFRIEYFEPEWRVVC